MSTTDEENARLTLYDIGQSAGEDWPDEFRALRSDLAGEDPSAIATTSLGGAIERCVIVTDHVAAGVDLWGKGFAEDGGVPMTVKQAIAYIDNELAGARSLERTDGAD